MGMTTDGLSYWQAESEGIDLLDLTMGDLLDQRAEEFPDQEALVYSCYPEFGDALNIRWTYRDYRDRATAIAKGLLARGRATGRFRSDEYAHRVAHRRHHAPPERARSPPSGEQRKRGREKMRVMKAAGAQAGMYRSTRYSFSGE